MRYVVARSEGQCARTEAACLKAFSGSRIGTGKRRLRFFSRGFSSCQHAPFGSPEFTDEYAAAVARNQEQREARRPIGAPVSLIVAASKFLSSKSKRARGKPITHVV
jgi:hypothetical protein